MMQQSLLHCLRTCSRPSAFPSDSNITSLRDPQRRIKSATLLCSPFKGSALHAAILAGSKTTLTLSRDHKGITFLSKTICELLGELTLDEISGVTMVIDGTKRETNRLCQGVATLFNQWPNHPNRPRGMESHQCDGIQIADMLAGATSTSNWSPSCQPSARIPFIGMLT